MFCFVRTYRTRMHHGISWFNWSPCLLCCFTKMCCFYLNVHLDFCVLSSEPMQSARLILVEKIFFSSLDLVWTLCFLLAYHSNPTFDQCLEPVPAKSLVLFPILAKSWCLSTKPFNPRLNEHSNLSRCRVFYCWAFHFQHLETCTLILAWLNMGKLNRFMIIITFWI